MFSPEPPAAFCPAEIRGYARVKTPEFYALRKKSGAATQGVVLLGLTDGEVAALNDFERVPDVMERRRVVVRRRQRDCGGTGRPC